MRRSVFDILLGFVLAIAGASVVMLAADVVRGAEPASASSIQAAIRTFLKIATFVIPLALVAIGLAEIRRVRGLAFWVAAGGGLAGLAYAVSAFVSAGNDQALISVLASGVAGGLIYWSIAGKRSGAFAAAVDRENRTAAINDAGARRRCWLCTAAMLLVGIVPLALIGWQMAERANGTWPDMLQRQAEEQGDRRLAGAGLPWATLKIENHIGRIAGTAPTLVARRDGFAKAEAALNEMVGLPGVVAYLQNDIIVAASAEQPPVIADDIVRPASRATTETRARRLRLGRGMREAKLRRWNKQQSALKLAEQLAAAQRRAAQEAEDVKRKADEARRAAEEAAAKAEDDADRAEVAKRKAEEDRRLALEAEREKDAVAAARKADADKVEAADNKDAAKDDAPAPRPTNCDAEFAELFKTSTVQFARNASALDEKLEAFFDNAAALANQCTDYTIDVAGHADRTGTEATNLAASLARAVAVRDALRARGVTASRLKATGYGDSRPLDPSHNRAAFARNRRVELSAERSVVPAPPPAQNVVVRSQATKPLRAAACHVRLNRAASAAGIHFAVNEARVRPADARALADIARVLRRCPLHALAINGHADRRGANEDNRLLSERRANAVRDILIQRGVAGDRLSAIGHGALRPRAKNGTRAAYAQNRRVDFDVSAIAPPP